MLRGLRSLGVLALLIMSTSSSPAGGALTSFAAAITGGLATALTVPTASLTRDALAKHFTHNDTKHPDHANDDNFVLPKTRGPFPMVLPGEHAIFALVTQ